MASKDRHLSGFCQVCKKYVSRFRKHILETCFEKHEHNADIRRLRDLARVADTKAEKNRIILEVAKLRIMWNLDSSKDTGKKKPCELGCGRKISPSYIARHQKKCPNFTKLPQNRFSKDLLGDLPEKT